MCILTLKSFTYNLKDHQASPAADPQGGDAQKTRLPAAHAATASRRHSPADLHTHSLFLGIGIP